MWAKIARLLLLWSYRKVTARWRREVDSATNAQPTRWNVGYFAMLLNRDEKSEKFTLSYLHDRNIPIPDIVSAYLANGYEVFLLERCICTEIVVYGLNDKIAIWFREI